MRPKLSAIAVALCLALSSPVLAQTSDPEQLFSQGSALMEQGKYADALPLLERAQKADPGIGTQFNIAVCHQKLGRLGSAFREFREVEKLARASGKKVREEAAREKLGEVKTRAPAFAIKTSEPGDVSIRIDGIAIAKEDWSWYPVDPGTHRVEAIAATKKPWSKDISTPAEGAVAEIVVPPLEVVHDTQIVTVTTTDRRRTLGYIFGGVGIAGVVAATVTGILLLQDNATAKDHCPDKKCVFPPGDPHAGEQDTTGADAVSRAKTLLPINVVSWVVAGAGLGAGAYFLLTSGKKQDATPTAIVTPTIGGAAVLGTF
jgi:hypothetical protein